MFELIEMLKAFVILAVWIAMFAAILDTIKKDYNANYAIWFCVIKGGLLFMMWLCTYFFLGGSFA